MEILDNQAEVKQTNTIIQQKPSSPYNSLKGLFFGSYNHSVDGKGRIIIPSSFRTNLGDDFVIAPTRDFMGIALYTNDYFLKIINELSLQDQSDPAIYRVTSMFMTFSYTEQQSDIQGRVLIPAKLRKLVLGEEKEIESVGEIGYIRIRTLNSSETFINEFMANRDKYVDDYNKSKKENELLKQKM